MWGVGRGSLLAGEKGCKYNVRSWEEGGGGGYFFQHGVDVRVLWGRGAGFRAVRGEVRTDLVVGEDGGLGFEDLHGSGGDVH